MKTTKSGLPASPATFGVTTTYTPGPWVIDRDNSTGIEVVGANGNLVHIEDYELPPERKDAEAIVAEARANAYLIAAAPELLDAVKHILPFLDAVAENFTTLEGGMGAMARRDATRLRAVISKTEGMK